MVNDYVSVESVRVRGRIFKRHTTSIVGSQYIHDIHLRMNDKAMCDALEISTMQVAYPTRFSTTQVTCPTRGPLELVAFLVSPSVSIQS